MYVNNYSGSYLNSLQLTVPWWHTCHYYNRLLHPSHWRAILIETPIIRLWLTDWFHLTTSLLSTVRPFQFSPPISGTVFLNCSHISIIVRGFLASFTFLFQRCSPDLIIWHSELTLCCAPSSNFVIQATWTVSRFMIDDDYGVWNWLTVIYSVCDVYLQTVLW